MIVNWTKPNAGLKVIPAQLKNNVVVGYVTLLPGNNDVPDDTWYKARHNLKNDNERGFIKENYKEEIVDEFPKNVREDSIETIVDDNIESLDLLALVSFLKINNFYKDAFELAKEYDKDLNKEFILSFIKESGPKMMEKAFSYFGLTGKTKYRVFKSLSLKEMSHEQALNVVLDTWNVDTLTKWRKEEGREEIRVAISNQIELVNKPPRGKQHVS